MVGKKSGRALLREEGLQRTDNNMDLTSFPQIPMINQKNYYTEFMKRDDQILALRLQNEEARNRMTKAARDKDRALAQNGASADPDVDMDDDAQGDEAMETEAFGSKTIVIHPGSQNLRIGLATDALPRTVPMVIARRSDVSESEEGDGEPQPKRQKLDSGELGDENTWFGKDFKKEYNAMAAEFKTFRRVNKRRVLPNSRELVWNWNSRNPPEIIPQHSDPLEIDWTDVSQKPEHVSGQAALRIPDDSKPRYKLLRPWQNGRLNEADYESKNSLFVDFFTIIYDAIMNEVGANRKKDWNQYSIVFIIPDLYEKTIVSQVLHELLQDCGFQRVCFIQESLAATFGAGYSSSCIVDVGAQKTSICCVEEGMCVENSRISLQLGGEDVTQAFIKMMLFDKLNYDEMNLKKRHDYLLAEELKQKYCTFSDEAISVQLYDFHVRTHGQDTRKYAFKIYDEVALAPMGLFRPNIFDHAHKLDGRRTLIQRSLDLYDGSPNDPVSPAQVKVIEYANDNIPSAISRPPEEPKPKPKFLTPRAPLSTSTPQRPSGLGNLSHLIDDGDPTPRSSPGATPAPDDATPRPARDGTPNGDVAEDAEDETEPDDPAERIVPIMPLDVAILTSITEGARGDERKLRDFLGGIMVIGGGAKIASFNSYLEYRLRTLRPDLAKDVLIGPPPRELDPQVLVWKGGSVFGKLRGTNDSWIGQLEYDRLGARILNYKCMWAW
ncbi:actin-related protein, ARP8 class [Myriangium duriaei CBS 260.36]|uniref:Actin-related protein, ARP8 class n=1 Tax=Myriangium duriaei CBS 260.36 TaxID=1168546 RepID=A0A9P4J6B5_9PEZI|nr:actin-related protein, ARP8 class [Myriangium duriaei CBS 260.36]